MQFSFSLGTSSGGKRASRQSRSRPSGRGAFEGDAQAQVASHAGQSHAYPRVTVSHRHQGLAVNFNLLPVSVQPFPQDPPSRFLCIFNFAIPASRLLPPEKVAVKMVWPHQLSLFCANCACCQMRLLCSDLSLWPALRAVAYAPGAELCILTCTNAEAATLLLLQLKATPEASALSFSALLQCASSNVSPCHWQGKSFACAFLPASCTPNLLASAMGCRRFAQLTPSLLAVSMICIAGPFVAAVKGSIIPLFI